MIDEMTKFEQEIRSVYATISPPAAPAQWTSRGDTRTTARPQRPTRPGAPAWKPASRVGSRVLVALALIVAATGIGSYFAPRFADALATAPGIGAFAGPILRDFQMAGPPGRVTPLSGTAVSSGYRVTLVGGYADATRTVLLLRIDDRRGEFPSLVGFGLTDQFGRSYQSGAGEARPNGAVVDELLTFSPLQPPASLVGARLTLHLQDLNVDLPPLANGQHLPPRLVQAHWTLHATLVLSGPISNLALPKDGTLGGSLFHFTSARATPVSIEIQLVVTGPLRDQLGTIVGPIIPGVSKGHPAFSIRLFGPSGAEISGYGGPNGVGQGDGQWSSLGPGTYRVVVSYAGVGEFERNIQVP
jgi:hypothetical protein